MSFTLRWTAEARSNFEELQAAAATPAAKRATGRRRKSSKQEGLLKQVAKTLKFLQENPRHPGLNTHEYHSLTHPYSPSGKVFEAYVQNRTPGAYRVFWCYGPERDEITLLAITPHP